MSEERAPGTGWSADRVIDEVLPEELEWRRLVQSYPLPAVAVAAVGGFFLGRHHGALLLSALGAFATREVSRNVSNLLGDEESASR